MKLKTKKRVDKYFGTLTLFVVSQIFRIGYLVFSRERTQPEFKDGDPILIMKFQGLGSLVLAKPGIHVLKNRYPHSKIYLWGTPATTGLAKLFPEFSGLIELDDRSFFRSIFSLLENLRKIYSIQPKCVFDLEVYSRLSSVLISITFAPYRIGFAIDIVGNRKYTNTHLLLFNRYQWIGTAYIRLLTILSANELKYSLDDFGQWNIHHQIPAVAKDKHYAVINMHSGDLSHERKWSSDSFKDLVNEILNWKKDLTIFLIGKGPDEVEISNDFAKQFSARVISVAGQLSLAETMNLLKFSEFVVSSDSGPMHLSIAMGTPTVCLFGPTRPTSYIVASKATQFVYKALYCSPCVHHWEIPPCNGNNQCMKTISALEVFEKIQLLQKNSVSNNAIIQPIKDITFNEGVVHKT
ncbi:MAG: glycosyltransferase family 9 protein [Bdellovibrionaceae bacterium]|nr:glycosyltransferase family 9 protein [Pseudobdellovibrionaceae bacterium]